MRPGMPVESAMRSILRAALVTGCAVAAIGGLVGVAAADAPPTDAVVRVYSAYLPPGHTDLPAFNCPDRFPHLFDQNLSPGRAVVRGMEVIEPGGMESTTIWTTSFSRTTGFFLRPGRRRRRG